MVRRAYNRDENVRAILVEQAYPEDPQRVLQELRHTLDQLRARGLVQVD